MAEIKSKIVKLELNNGETIELTLNFARMIYLRANGFEKEVNACMKMVNAVKLDMLDMPDFIFGAYLCANKDPKYTKRDFIELLPWDAEILLTVYTNLNSQKKTTSFAKRSSVESRNAK